MTKVHITLILLHNQRELTTISAYCATIYPSQPTSTKLEHIESALQLDGEKSLLVDAMLYL
jgi:hypothetical protein